MLGLVQFRVQTCHADNVGHKWDRVAFVAVCIVGLELWAVVVVVLRGIPSHSMVNPGMPLLLEPTKATRSDPWSRKVSFAVADEQVHVKAVIVGHTTVSQKQPKYSVGSVLGWANVGRNISIAYTYA